MKVLVILFLTMSCTQKYQTYHVIDSRNFSIENPDTPITKKMIPQKKVVQSNCIGQWLFSSNAQKENIRYIEKNLVGRMCDSQYLLNARLTETWWTTIIYSRSCFELEAYCPRKD